MNANRLSGFTLLEVMIVVAIIAILAAIAIPQLSSYRKTSQMKACESNIEMLDRATEAYIIKNNLLEDVEVTLADLVPQEDSDSAGRAKYFIMYNPTCSAGGEYRYDTGTHSWYCTLGGDATANGGYPHGPGAGK